MFNKLNITKEKVIISLVSGLIFGLIGFYAGKYMQKSEMSKNIQERRNLMQINQNGQGNREFQNRENRRNNNSN